MHFKILQFSSIFFICVQNIISAQEIIYNNDKNEAVTYSNDNNKLISNNSEKKSRINYQLDLGSSVALSSSNYNALSFYAAPHLRYKFTPKLNISAGFMLINTSASGYYMNIKRQNNNLNQIFIFSGFDYKATERLIIAGDIMYGMNKFPDAFYDKNKPSDYYLRFSADYKINDNFSIGLRIINQNSVYPAYENYFGNYSFGNYNPLFDPFNRW